MKESDVQLVQSLSRGLAVIRAFDGTRPRQTLAQVAEVTGLPRATTRRFLHTLVAEGFARTDGTVFWLTPKTLELGYSYPLQPEPSRNRPTAPGSTVAPVERIVLHVGA